MLELQSGFANDDAMDVEAQDREYELDRGRARWRSRRGMLELDLVLVAFVDGQFDSLDADEQHRYIELLGLDDFDIWDWLQGVRSPPVEFEALIERIQASTGR